MITINNLLFKMSENKNDDSETDKPINIVLLGDESSEKEKLLLKYIEITKDLEENNSIPSENLIENIVRIIKINGEMIKIKIWDNPASEEFLSPSIKIAKGILLFYSVEKKSSFENIQKNLNKIKDMNKFNIPIVIIGNHCNSNKREVSYDEAKTFAENNCLRFYETSIDSKIGIKEILNDIGEQLIFQECIKLASNEKIEEELLSNLNIDDNLNIADLIENNNKNDEKLKRNKSSKHLSDKSKNNNLKNLSKSEIRELKIIKNINTLSTKLKKTKTKNLFTNFIKNSNECNKNNRNNKDNNKTFNESFSLNDSCCSEYSTTNNKSKKNIKNSNKHPIRIINNSSKNINDSENIKNKSSKSSKNTNLNKSSVNIHSYLKRTTNTKNREKIVQNEKIEKEKDLNSNERKLEREAIELKKQKAITDKENLIKKAKDEKIIIKDKDKQIKEEENLRLKNNYEKAKKDRELNEKELQIEKEKNIQNIMQNKHNDKEKMNKLKEKKDNQREKELQQIKDKKESHKKEDKKNYVIKKNNTMKKTDKDRIRKLNTANNSRKGSLEISNKNKEKVVEEKKNEEKNNNIKEEEEKIKQNNENKENIKKNYNQIYNNVYRCLNCKLIPKIIINEFSKEVLINCDCGISTHNNIVNYKAFEEKSLNHNSNNSQCDYCNKKINELPQNEILYYCMKCDNYFCSIDEQLHFNQNHNQKENITKNKYKNLIKEKITKKVTEEPKKMKKNFTAPKLTVKKEIADKNNSKKSKIEKNENEDKNTNKNNDEILDKVKELNNENHNKYKIPVYLIDTCCLLHDHIFNSYCHTCKKNVCDICKISSHQNHEIQSFDDIFINEETLNQKKSELKIVNENLTKLNDYFISLIEEIKSKFLKLYNLKKNEIQIKENIIKNYEKIKYNYNAILNMNNLKIDNKSINLQNVINNNQNTNENWLEKINFIFEYLNSPLLDNNSNFDVERKFKCKNNISNAICLNEEGYICLSDDKGTLKIYDTINFDEKIKIFNGNKIINNLYQLSNGNIACCCNDRIEIFNFDLLDKYYYVNEIIENKNNNFMHITELRNNFLLTTGTKNKLQLWYKTNNKRNFINYDVKNSIDFTYKINDDIFLTSDNTDKKINFFSLAENNESKNISNIDNISIINGNNPMTKFGNKYLLICGKDDYKGYEIIFIELINYKLVNKIRYGLSKLIFINSVNEFVITVDNNGLIKKWRFKENSIYNCDKMNIIDDNNKMKFMALSKNKKRILGVSNENEVIFLDKFFLQSK